MNANSKTDDLDSAWKGSRWEWGHLPEIVTSEPRQEGERDLEGPGDRIGEWSWGMKTVHAERRTCFGMSGGGQEGSSHCPGGGQNFKCLE